MGASQSIVDRRAELNSLLLDYHRSYAAINPQDMAAAREVVDDIKDEIRANLEDALDLIVERVGSELEDTGSVAEGLKVVKPDEFDVMILMTLNPNSSWKIVPVDADCYILGDEPQDAFGGYSFVSQSYSRTQRRSQKPLESIVNELGYLDPVKVKRHFQSAIVRLLDSPQISNKYRIKLGVKGPLIWMEVIYDLRRDPKQLCIDFVPTVVIGDAWYVEKQHYMVDQEGAQQHVRYLWRKSTSIQELDRFWTYGSNNGHRKVLMIMKAIRLNHRSVFGMLDSFHYKTVMLHLMGRTANRQWTDDLLLDRLQDYFKLLTHFVKSRTLPHYFIPRMNLFDKCHILEGSLQQIEYNLALRINIDNLDDIATLLAKRNPNP